MSTACGPRCEVISLEYDLAAEGAVEPAAHIQKRGLPGAVRTDDSDEFATVNGEADIVEGADAAEQQVTELKNPRIC